MQWLPISLPEAPWWQQTEPCSSSPGVLLQPESAHPARQGRAKVPTCSPSQPAPWAASVVTGTTGTVAHGHLQGRGLQTQVQELSQPCQPWSDPTFAGWCGGLHSVQMSGKAD